MTKVLRTRDVLVPKIENIHSRVLNAVLKSNTLESVFSSCKTTHCRAEWVVLLAAKEGRALEQELSTVVAADIIYNANSNISVDISRYYISENEALDDMMRCAKLERDVIKGPKK